MTTAVKRLRTATSTRTGTADMHVLAADWIVV